VSPPMSKLFVTATTAIPVLFSATICSSPNPRT
jgi:hypothetical protein